jgi:hypothetical protein
MKVDRNIVLKNICYPESERLVSNILEYASVDQSKTNVDLSYVTARVYSAHRQNRNDFDDYVNWLSEQDFMEGYDIEQNPWGIVYGPYDICSPHDHSDRYAAIHYLKADGGCGLLGLQEDIIEPEDNLLVLIPPKMSHYVLPAENEDAQRICMVFNFWEKQ